MKLGYTILYVKNVLETVEFYEKAFSLKRKFVHEGGDYGELSTGETTLAFINYELAESNKISFNAKAMSGATSAMELAFVTENVESSFQIALLAGAIEVVKPHQKPWGQTLAYVRDLNGFIVEICSPVGN